MPLPSMPQQNNPFDLTQTAQIVHETLAQALTAIPEGKRAALLVLAGPEGGQVVLAARVGKNWELAAAGSKPWEGPVEGRVTLKGSW